MLLQALWRGALAVGVLLGIAGAASVVGQEPSGTLERPSDRKSPNRMLEQFLVKDCTGPAAGKTLCYFCRYAERPVIAVFVRRLDDGLGQLAAQVDAAVQKHRTGRLGAMIVYVGPDTRDAERRLRQIARDRRLKHTPLTIYRDDPDKLRVPLQLAPTATVTLLGWKNRTVRSQQSFATAKAALAAVPAAVAAVK